MRKQIKMGVGIGGPSIIMIFVVLCLTVLSALGLTTANADYKLTQKTAEAVTTYYQADSAAAQWLAQLDADLKAGRQPASTTFRTPLSEQQELVLTVQITGSAFRIQSDQVVSTAVWDYEANQPQFDDSIVE